MCLVAVGERCPEASVDGKERRPLVSIVETWLMTVALPTSSVPDALTVGCSASSIRSHPNTAAEVTVAAAAVATVQHRHPMADH